MLAVSLWRGHPYLAIARRDAFLRLLAVRFVDGGFCRGGEFESPHWMERRRIWCIGLGVSQHRLYGRTTLGGALGCSSSGAGYRDYFGGFDHHLVFVHRLVAFRRGG